MFGDSLEKCYDKIVHSRNNYFDALDSRGGALCIDISHGCSWSNRVIY